MAKKKFELFLIGYTLVMIFGVLIFCIISFNGYRKKTKDYKTPMGWALEEARNNFFYIRDNDEIYVYEIKELSIGNFDPLDEPDYYGEYLKMFYIKMIDDSFNYEEYVVVITYNLDKSFWAKLGRMFGKKNELIGIEHIVWVDIDEK